MFHACTCHIMAQASGEYGSGDQFYHHRDGILSCHHPEYRGEPMVADPSHFHETNSRYSEIHCHNKRRVHGHPINLINQMIRKILDDKPTKLFVFFTSFFVANALIAECIGGKLFSLESTLGLKPSSFSLFGQSGLSFTLTCGVLLWPLEFVITDIINEFYGPKAVRRISFTAVILISYAFLIYFLAINILPADVWIASSGKQGVENIQTAFSAIFGQNMSIILGSLVARWVSQSVDVTD